MYFSKSSSSPYSTVSIKPQSKHSLIHISDNSLTKSFVDMYAYYDSVVVAYDGQVRAIHETYYALNNHKAVVRSSTRNLLNKNAYKYTLIKKRANYLDEEYTYTFTEQDYLDAQK